LADKEKKDKKKIDRSPQPSITAQRRRKILSPKRKKFETKFESYMYQNQVKAPVDNIPQMQQARLT
jgi:hypothetical protein